MKLIQKKIYKKIEAMLYEYKQTELEEQLKNCITELLDFFKNSPSHTYFINKYYFERYQYKNRYPKNSQWLRKICRDLYIVPSTGYEIRTEIIYKLAMILYKNGVIE